MRSVEQFSENSDLVRNARPLRYAKSITLPGPVQLAHGGSLPEITIAYETYGTLSPARDNAIFICHALTGDSHVARHHEQDDPGWWDILIGSGKPIDTNRYYVICANVLGGCRGTTGPSSINPHTGRPYGGDFPLITIGDIVHVHHLLLKHLQIHRLQSLVGGSLGGHMVLDWATRYPDEVDLAVVMASSAYITAQTLAFDVVGRAAILNDPDFAGGHYYDRDRKPDAGLALARMLGHITYLSPESMTAKFSATPDISPAGDFETALQVGSYLHYQGKRFVERFDANSYITLTRAMDQFDLGRTVDRLADSLAASICRWLIISFSSDTLFPPHQSQQIVDALALLSRSFTHAVINSPHGHDAFLLKHDIETYGSLIRSALEGKTRKDCQATHGVLQYVQSLCL